MDIWYAEDVKFTVEDTGEIQKVVMKDEVKPEENTNAGNTVYTGNRYTENRR